TLGASFVRHLADTRQKSQRPVQRSNQRAHRDALRQFAEVIPATFTFLLCRNPFFLSSRRMSSRNFDGIRSRLAISPMRSGPLPYSFASIAIALSLYFAFFDSILQIL